MQCTAHNRGEGGRLEEGGVMGQRREGKKGEVGQLACSVGWHGAGKVDGNHY